MAIIITITQSIKLIDIADLLCGALEGGSNYWYEIEDKTEPTKWIIDQPIIFSTKEEAEKNNKHYLHFYPLNPGGSLVFTTLDDEKRKKKEHILNLQNIQIGLQQMAVLYPKHFADFQSNNYDGITSDVFLQMCLFGKIIYS